MKYNLEQLWNAAVYSRQRPLEPRDYCYASEMGGALIDRWLKMRAVEQTNPPNMRSLRKFEAGNLTEWLVRFVLSRAGLIKETQERVNIEYDGLVPVHGRLDFLVGGFIDIEKAKADVKSLHLPESIEASSLYIAENLFNEYGNAEFETKVMEIKSCSSFVMDAMEKEEKPIKRHIYQLYHYMKGLNVTGELVYICKDDLRMKCFEFEATPELERMYVSDLMAITKFHTSDVRPDAEPLISLENGKFKKNFEVEYSSYLKLIYGFETPREYSDTVKSKVSRWSRVVARYAMGENITKKNEEVRAEIEREGYDFESVVNEAKKFGVEQEEEQ